MQLVRWGVTGTWGRRRGCFWSVERTRKKLIESQGFVNAILLPNIGARGERERERERAVLGGVRYVVDPGAPFRDVEVSEE